MQIEILDWKLTVCKVESFADIDLAALRPCFIAATDTENSLVCATAEAPAETLDREDGWQAMRVVGSLDFGLVGILANLTDLLAAAGIPVFAVSTFDTDYLLVKEEFLEDARTVLEAAEHEVIG